MSEIDLRQLSANLPRYTSYPPATRFRDDIDPARLRAWLAEAGTGAPLAAYLHVPYCRSLCWYCGCHAKVNNRPGPIARYAGALAREIDLVSWQLAAPPPVASVHWGGGTPSQLGIAHLADVMDRLRARFAIAPDAEIAIELDPRTVNPDLVGGLAGLGVNRVSFGVQSLSPSVQLAVNRWQPEGMVRQAVAACREAGITRISFDLMYGLPNQTEADVARSVDFAAGLGVPRLALFGYAHVPWFRANQKLIDESRLPDAEARWRQAESAAARIVAAGYRRIGLDHFALPDDALARALEAGRLRRNFQGYVADQSAGILGFGASAISSLPRGFVQNVTDIRAYRARIDEGALPGRRWLAVDADDRFRGEIIERLMCDMRVDLDAVCRRHGRGRDDLAAALDRIDGLVAEGVAQRRGPVVSVPENRRPLVRLVASAFDAHLPAEADRAFRHAVAV